MDLFGGLSVKQEASKPPSPAPEAPATPAEPEAPEAEPEAPPEPEPSLLDLRAEPEVIRAPTPPVPEPPKPVARRPIVKKKRAKRVGYERTEDDAAPPTPPPPEPEPEPVAPEPEPSPVKEEEEDPDEGLSAEQAAWLHQAAEAPAPAPKPAPPARPHQASPKAERKKPTVISKMEEAGKRLTGVFKRPSPRTKSPPARAPTPDVAPSSSEEDEESDLEAKVRAAMARNDSDESVDELDYAPREEVVQSLPRSGPATSS